MSENPDWRELASDLLTITPAGKLDDAQKANRLIFYGLLENKNETTACKTCGHPRSTYSYVKMTQAGRLLVTAYQDAARTKDTDHG